ncbi:MAG TPA: ABC transporter permease [Candidatus Sulfotelmatobacter sp.]|nr:ABC transporter permease [Candidatus Sulfotelmatobacter sp.]
MSGLIQDIRYALRQLRKSPAFTAVAVLTLALGLGANSAVFSVIDAVLLRPLPFHVPSRLVVVKPTEPGRHDDIGTSYPTFLDWRTQNHVFEGLSVFRVDDFTLTGRGEAAHLTGSVVSANLFSVLGVPPAMGRAFIPEEDQPTGTGLPVMLSHNLWQNRFGSDPKIVGQSLTLDGQTFSVVGVMPVRFQFPVQRTPVEFWTTIALDAQSANGSPPMTAQRGAGYLLVVARLKAQVTADAAQIEMGGIQAGLNRQYPENRPMGISLVPEADAVVGDMRQGLFILLGAVGLVLLIACANLSNLLLARAATRNKEISVRTALGATRWMIVRQLLAESFLLAAAGAAAGLGLAAWGIKLLTALAPGDLPRITESGLNLQVLIFTTLVAVLTSVLFGLVPALQAAKPQLAASLNEGGRSGTDTVAHGRLRSALIVTEMAIAMVLLVGAGLLLRSLLGLGRVDPGFAKDHVITFGLDLPDRYGHPQKIAFYRSLLEQVRATPGVGSASAAFPLPLSGGDVRTTFEVQDRPMKHSEYPVTTLHIIDRDYFRTLGIPLLRGREFNPQDDAAGATAVVVISQTLAEQVFPGEDPVGRRIRPNISSGPGEAPMRVIVGVVGDVKAEGLGAPSIPESYLSYAQLPFAPMSVVVRTDVAPENIVSTLTREVQSLDNALPLLHVKTLDEYVDDSIVGTRFETFLLGTFGALAFLLTAVGLYGMISYTVVQRSREMGIRLALGADRSAILGMIVKDGTLLACAGALIGLAAAFLLTRLMASLLFGVGPTDPLTFLCVPIALITVAILASYIPARRAAKVDPMVALRYE